MKFQLQCWREAQMWIGWTWTHLLNIIESLSFAHIALSQCTSDTINRFTKVVTCKFDNLCLSQEALNSGDHPLHFVSDEKSVVIAQGRLCARVEVNNRVSLKLKNSLFEAWELNTHYLYVRGVHNTHYLVFGFGHRKSQFLAPGNGHFHRFWEQKMGLRKPDSENGEHFLTTRIIPQIGGSDTCFRWISLSGEFWANFEIRVS